MISVGSTDISKVYVGSTEATTVYLGSTKVWPVTKYSYGINKVGNVSIGTNVWTTLTGWSVRSDYPDTVITSDGLLLPAGINVTVFAQNQRSAANAGNKVRLWDAVTSTVLSTGTSSGQYPNISYNFTPTADVIVQLQVIATSSLTGNRSNIAAGTFMTADEY